MLSTTVIETPLSILLIDATENAEGWEWDVSQRLVTVLGKRGVGLVGDGLFALMDGNDLARLADQLATASCIVLLGSANNSRERLLNTWDWLLANVEGPKLAVACHWGAPDSQLTDAVLGSTASWAPIAIAQETNVLPREGALFLLKFLTEMDLHSTDRITGRMAWFAWKKAGELLKRRRMNARFGLRT